MALYAQDHFIKRAISDYDWITELNLRNTIPNLQVEHLTEVLNNVLTNLIPHDDATIKPTALGLLKTFQGVIMNTSGLINPILGMDVNLK